MMTTKKKAFIATSAKKVFAHEFWSYDQYFGGLNTSVAPGLLLCLGHNPRLGGTILVWGAQAVILGRHDPGIPPWRRA